MADAERVPTAPRSPDPPKTVSPRPAGRDAPPGAPSKWGHLGLLVLAGLGATFGFLTGIGLYGEVRFEPLAFVFQALILGSAAYVLFDPAMELLHDRLGAS